MAGIASFLGLVVVTVLLGIAALHVYWAIAGSGPGAGVVPTMAGEKPLFTPGKAATLMVALLLTLAAILVYGASGRFGTPALNWAFRLGTAVVGVVFGLRAIGDFHWCGFFKTERTSLFARRDTLIYSPLCLGLAMACGLIAATGPFHDAESRPDAAQLSPS